MSLGYIPGSALSSALVAPSGTALLFNNSITGLPNGWAQNTGTTFTDCSVRINNATGGNSGGTTAWSNWNFGGTFAVNGFTLSAAQVGVHSHSIPDPGHVHGVNDPGHSHTFAGLTWWLVGGADLQEGTNARRGAQISSPTINGSGTGISIAGAFTGQNATANAGSSSGIFPTYTTPQVKYTDFCLAVKL